MMDEKLYPTVLLYISIIVYETKHIFMSVFLFLSLFIYFERERERESVHAQERCTEGEEQERTEARLDLRNFEIMT